MQVKRFVRTVPIKFKPGPRETLEEARVVVRAVYGSSPGYQDVLDDVFIVEDEIDEEDAL